MARGGAEPSGGFGSTPKLGLKEWDFAFAVSPPGIFLLFSLRMRLHLDAHRVSARKIQPAVDALLKGQVVIYPTDTGYAFGCSIQHRKAIDQLRRLKGLSPKDRHPLTLLLTSIQEMSEYGHMHNQAFRLVRRILPGPYTVVLNSTSSLPRDLRNKNGEVGLRIPDDPVCQAILSGVDGPLFSASVRPAEEAVELEEPESLELRYGRSLAVIVDVGPIWPEPSTVLRMSGPEIEVLREGKGELPI